MFGRLRSSSSSLDTLERPPSKIFKDDPLSIYETTLIKLKLGSQRPSEDEPVEMESDCSTNTDSTNSTETNICTSTNGSRSCQYLVISPDEDSMTIDTNNSCSSLGTGQSAGDSKQQQNRNISLVYLFSKYQSSRHASISSNKESMGMMVIESDGYASSSTTTNNCQSFGCSTKEQSEHEDHSTSSGFHI